MATRNRRSSNIGASLLVPVTESSSVTRKEVDNVNEEIDDNQGKIIAPPSICQRRRISEVTHNNVDNNAILSAVTKAQLTMDTSKIPSRRAVVVGDKNKVLKREQKFNIREEGEDDALQPNFSYCKEIKGDVMIMGKTKNKPIKSSITWTSQFERPLEDMFYPSIQYLEFDKTQRKNIVQKSSIRSTTPSSAEDLQETRYAENEKYFKEELPSWTLNLAEFKQVKSSEVSILEQINTDGEKILRKKMQTKYFERIENEKLEAERKARESSDIPDIGKRFSQKGLKLESMMKRFQGSADLLYWDLKKKHSKETRNSKHSSLKLEVTKEEEIFQNEFKKVKKMLGDDSMHHLQGLLYYDIKHENRLKLHPENDTGTGSPKTSYDDGHRHFTFDALVTDLASDTVHSMGKASKSSSLQELSRVKQTIRSASIGYDMRDVVERDPFYIENIIKDKDVNDAFSSLSVEAPSFVELLEPSEASNRLSTVSAQVNKRRVAQDLLLLNQLEKGIIPESFFKRRPEVDGSLVIDINNYGIGDVQGDCLGKSLKQLNNLSTLILRNNRLTDQSLKTIMSNVCYNSLEVLDLSQNCVSGSGVSALAMLLKSKVNNLHELNLSKCNIDCADMQRLCSALEFGSNTLQKLVLTYNKISSDGCKQLQVLMSAPSCRLVHIDLSWNDCGGAGAIHIADALFINKTVTHLNLSVNQVTDQGGQKLAACLDTNHVLKEIILAQNVITGQACFVFSKNVFNHPSMVKLDLSLNPVGDAGARAIFRTILRGLKCFVMMRSCTYRVDYNVFNHSSPSVDSPYTLNLEEPYNASVLHELISMSEYDPDHCGFGDVTYQSDPKSAAAPINLRLYNNELCLRDKTTKWIPPKSGIITCSFAHSISIPTLSMVVSEQALSTLQLILIYARSDSDRRNWIQLICKDAYFTTTQIQSLIDKFINMRLIGFGGITKLDIFKGAWSRLVDSENKFDFLYQNLDETERKDLLYAISFECFKLTWKNPTAHWRIDLQKPELRALLLQLVAINNKESENSRLYSKRGDTSQKGNWNNFRNEVMYDHNGMHEFVLDQEFVENMPSKGIVEFDYVSTTRPNSQVHENSSVVDQVDDDESDNLDDMQDNNEINSVSKQSFSAPQTPATGVDNPIGEDVLYQFMDKMGLTLRKKITRSESLYILTDLQIASVKYYFKVAHVLSIMDCFVDDPTTQSRIAVLFFNRIWDLYNFDYLLRSVSKIAQNDIVLRLGWLNVFNPLKPSFEYNISLKYVDGRILLVSLLELGSLENGEQIREDPRTDVLLVSLYGSLHRVLNDVRDEIVRFYYFELGERSNTVSWSGRRDLLKKFLVGTSPINREIFNVCRWYKEMEQSGTLTMGPLDLQYANHLRIKRNPKKK